MRFSNGIPNADLHTFLKLLLAENGGNLGLKVDGNCCTTKLPILDNALSNTTVLFFSSPFPKARRAFRRMVF